MSEWINVYDDIPEIGYQSAPYNWSKQVLVFLSDETIHIACLTDVGFWKNFEGKYSIKNESVKYWMPLPEPPKG